VHSVQRVVTTGGCQVVTLRVLFVRQERYPIQTETIRIG
jgi:hypothetical protein